MAASWLGSRVFFCVVAIFLSISGVLGIDVSTELDFQTELQQRQQFGNSSFIFSFNDPAPTANGDLRTLFVNNDEALATLPNGGVAQNLVTLKACAVNQPHNHPRGTEISHVLKGSCGSIIISFKSMPLFYGLSFLRLKITTLRPIESGPRQLFVLVDSHHHALSRLDHWYSGPV